MNKKIGFILLLLLMGIFLFSLPLQAQVKVCEDDDANEASCTTLEYDVDDLDDFNDEGKDLGDEISHIIIDPYTSVVLYKDKYFDEENIVYTISATSSGDTLDADELRSLGLHDEISSIKIHPQEIASCNSDTFIDDCLMEAAKPILIYDEETSDCNDRFHDGEAGFRSAVQTVDDQYKIVFYEIYHKEDCGPGGVAEDIYDDSHEDDSEVARFVFQKIGEGGETYWALVASRYQHHACTTDKQLEEMTWPLRIYISEGKHAQFISSWECEEWGAIDAKSCEEGTWTEILDDGWGFGVQEYEDCDYWPRSLTSEADTASDGGEILYPEEYTLVDGSFSDSTDWFGDTITLDEAGLLVLQSADYSLDGETITSGEYKTYEANSITASNFTIEAGSDGNPTTVTFDAGSTITASGFTIAGSYTEVTMTAGSTITIRPEFHVARGAEFRATIE